MDAQEKSPPAANRTGLINRLVPAKDTVKPRKWQRVLAAFLDGRSFNRFEAERIGDHALHSTVSALQARGVVINRRDETVSGFGGAPTRVCRYWLSPDSRQRAAELLGLENAVR